MAKLTFVVPLPESLSLKKRTQLAEAIITHIQGRTMGGLDKNNEPFEKYSTEYAKFKGSSDVDLVLSGEMLSELKLVKSGPDYLEIGYKGAKKLIGKVEGNILGTYGQPEPIPGKARDFLGIDEDDFEILLDAYESQDSVTEEDIDRIARDAAREILGDIDFSLDELDES